MSRIQKYKICIFNNIQASFIYRFQFFSGLFILLIPFIIKICLWKLAFTSNNFEEIRGYTYNEMISYNTFAMVFAYLSTSYFQYNVASEIKDGTLSRYLVKPINHMFYWGSMFIGDKVINFIYVLVFIVLSGTFYGHSIEGHITVYNIPFAIIAVFFSAILNFIIYYVISLLAFWFLDISYFFAAVTFIISVISGEIVPIDVMPVFFERLFSIMPFSYSVYFPVQTLMGKLSIHQILFKLVIQILWIILIALIGKLVWNTGIKKYESVGG